MPRRYKKKQPSRRKKYVRRSKRKDMVTSVGLSNPFPMRYKARLRYHEQVGINPGLASMAYHLFRANSPYDPNYTGTGHQPRAFDQLMANYDHFYVTRSKIRVVGANGTNSAKWFAIQLADDNNINSQINDIIEQRNSAWTVLAEQNAGGMTKTLVKYYTPGKFLGRKATDSQLKGTAASNPEETAFFAVCCQEYDAGGDAENVYFQVIIDYDVVFCEPKRLTQS